MVLGWTWRRNPLDQVLVRIDRVVRRFLGVLRAVGVIHKLFIMLVITCGHRGRKRVLGLIIRFLCGGLDRAILWELRVVVGSLVVLVRG